MRSLSTVLLYLSSCVAAPVLVARLRTRRIQPADDGASTSPSRVRMRRDSAASSVLDSSSALQRLALRCHRTMRRPSRQPTSTSVNVTQPTANIVRPTSAIHDGTRISRQIFIRHMTSTLSTCNKNAALVINPLMGTGNYSATSSNEVGTLADDGWTVTFCTARRGLGRAAARPGPSSLYHIVV